jgi:hypothetical protein
VYEKKGRCFSPSAQKVQVSSTSKQFIHGGEGKNILQGMDKFIEKCLIPKLQHLLKVNSNVSLELFAAASSLHHHPSSFGSLFFGFVILYIAKCYKVNSRTKENVSNMYEFITGLR